MFQKLNYLNYYDHLQREFNSTSLLVEYARTIEADEGRQNIRISDGPVPTVVLRAHQTDSQSSSASPVFLGTASVICSSISEGARLCWFVSLLCLRNLETSHGGSHAGR